VRLACGAQCQPSPEPLPPAAGLQDQAPSLGLALEPLTALMAQLLEYVVVHQGVSSSLFLAVVRVGLGKWA
jgi:hypothetical protein